MEIMLKFHITSHSGLMRSFPSAVALSVLDSSAHTSIIKLIKLRLSICVAKNLKMLVFC